MKNEFHHIGIPTTTRHANEVYLAEAKLYVTDATRSDNRIEWLRFEPDSPMPDLLKTTAHVAFSVDNLEQALAGQKVIIPPFAPMEGVRVAFIQEDQAPVEFMEFTK